MKRSGFSEEQIIGVLKEAEAGVPVKDLCRRVGVSEATFYHWKAKYGGMEVNEARRLRQMEEENGRLKRIVAQQALDLDALKQYTIYGYKGKQVRDQIHCRDVARLFLEFFQNPRCGEVYNLGGGRPNSVSILETIRLLRDKGLDVNYRYDANNRTGDHICYISDLTKVRNHFPNWKPGYDLNRILDEIIEWQRVFTLFPKSNAGSDLIAARTEPEGRPHPR